VISAGNYIRTQREQFLRDLRSYAKASGGIFTVDDDQIGAFTRDDISQMFADHLAAGRADNISNEKYAHELVEPPC
jgi:hypothetical protein